MADLRKRPIAPVAPDGMDIVFFYPCPACGKHVIVSSPIEPQVVTCDKCTFTFPIIPVDEQGMHYIRIMLASGKAAADPDFL